MITRNGIVYSLKISPYIIRVGDITYYFSSKNHLEKFTEKLYENRNTLNASLSRRFSVSVEVPTLCDIVLYSKVETRGFYITCKGVEYTCLNNITLSGATLTQKS